MKDRIRQIQTQKNLSQVQFATETGISTATLSGIYTGRTQPTNAIISRIHTRFPEISVSWLMFGEGGMTETEQAGDAIPGESVQGAVRDQDLFQSGQGVPFSSVAQQPQNAGMGAVAASSQTQHSSSVPVTIVKEIVKNVDKPQRRITEIRVFFDDGTYETFG